MLRAAIRQSRAVVRANAPRPAATLPFSARWARYNSTESGSPSLLKAKQAPKEVNSDAPGPSKTSDVGTEANPKPAITPEAVLAQDKQMDDALNEALIQALKEMDVEANPEEQPLRVQGFDEPILDSLPSTPNAKYPLSNLPLPAPTPESPEPTHDEEAWHATLIHGRSALAPVHHTPTYRIPAAALHLRSYHHKHMDFFAHFAMHAAASLGIPVSKLVRLPTQRSLWTVPRSPFAHKKSQENFERKTHKRLIKAWDADPEVLDVWFAYLRKHALPGVGMRVVRWERMPLGGERAPVGRVPSGGERGKQTEVKKLAEQIVEKEAKKVEV